MLKADGSVLEIEPTVVGVIRQILLEKPGGAASAGVEVTGKSALHDLGLTSLDLAQLVALLEIRLGADPFQELVPITSVRTVGDVCRAFDSYFAGDQGGSAAAALMETKRRAEGRRKS